MQSYSVALSWFTQLLEASYSTKQMDFRLQSALAVVHVELLALLAVKLTVCEELVLHLVNSGWYLFSCILSQFCMLDLKVSGGALKFLDHPDEPEEQ